MLEIVFFYVLCFTRPRYQVSVYRTIGPLFFFIFCFNDFFCNKLGWKDEIKIKLKFIRTIFQLN